MRIDKYLKVARILKKREIAKELSLNERLLVNGKTIKASYEIKIGDVVTIVFGNRTIKLKVLQIKENVSKQESLSLYEIVEEKTKQDI